MVKYKVVPKLFKLFFNILYISDFKGEVYSLPGKYTTPVLTAAYPAARYLLSYRLLGEAKHVMNSLVSVTSHDRAACLTGQTVQC